MTNTSKDTVGASSTNNGSLALAPRPPIPPQVPVTPPAKPLPLPKTGPSSKHPATARPPGWQFQRGKQTTPADARKIIDGRVHDQSKIYKPKSKLGFASNTVQGPASIVELARALKNDPQLIYEFVYNNIEWEPGFGVQKGGLGCLLDGMGNSFDQSMLLVELLREAGFTADYVLGTIQLTEAELMAWFGTSDIWGSASYCGNENIPYQSPTWNGTGWDMVMSHMWVNVDISATTYVMDPSYKTYNRTAAVSGLGTILGYNAGTFLSNAQSGATVTTDYVEDLNTANIHGDLTTMTSNLTTWIQANHPDATVDDILGGQAIVPVSLPITFPTSLPYQAPGDTPTVWTTDIPLAYKTTLQVQFPDNGSGWCIDETFTSDQLAGKRLTLFFNGSLQPVLALDGSVVATGIAQGSGTWNSVLLTVTHNGYPVTWYDQQWWQSFIWAGQYYLIGNAWGNLGRGQLDLHAQKYAANVAAGGGATSEPVLGEALATTWFTWAAQNSRVCDLVNRIMNCHTMNNHQVGIVSLDAGPLTGLDIGGVSGSSTNLDNDVTKTPINDTVLAMHGVALEAATLMQVTGSGTAASTTTVIDAASTNGSKVYKGTGSNWNTGSNISSALVTAGYNSTDMSDIYNWYLQWGWDVTLADDPAVMVDTWQGWGDFLYPGLSGAFGLIMGGLKGGKKKDPPKPPKSPQGKGKGKGDPVDQFTGAFLDETVDITLGSQKFPYQLSFGRSYSSADRHTEGPLGWGWTHNHVIEATFSSDGLLAMGGEFAIQGAAAIAELFVSCDLVSDTSRPVEKLITMTLANKWWIDQITYSTVDVVMGNNHHVFVKQPDGSYTAPSDFPGTLTLAASLYSFTTPQGEVFTFNAAGQIDTWVSPSGVTITYTYASGLLSTISNGLGRTLTLNYTSGSLTSVTDGTGRSVSYGYDGSNNLTSYTDADAKVTTLAYDVPGRLTEFFYPANPLTAFVSNVYDSLGRVMTQENARNQQTEFYLAGSRAEMIDSLSNSSVFYMNRFGKVIQSIDELGNVSLNEYDGLNRLVVKTFPEGNREEFTYDGNNNVLTKTQVAKPGSGLSDIVETFTYDATWAKMATYQDGRLNTSTFTYDSLLGNLLTIQRPVVGGLTPTVTMTWNARGQVLTHEDESGVVTKFVYDATTEKMTSRIVDYNVGAGHLNLTTSFGHDSVGNVTSVTDANSNQTTFVFDAMRRPTQRTEASPLSYVANFVYDDNGNRVSVERQTGGSPAWQIYSWTYSVTDKVLTEVDPATNTTTMTYDGKDRLQTRTDAESRLWQFDYDAMDRVNQVTDPSSTVCDTRTYTDNGKLASVEDARSNITQYTYDGFDRLDETIYADSTFEQNSSYDDNGNILTHLTRSGSSVVNTYDALNRLSTKSPTSQPVVTLTYDLVGRLTQASKPVVSGDPSSGAIDFAYDTAGRIYEEQYPDGKTVTHELDDNGNWTKTTWPDGYYVTRVFDEMNRLTDIKLNGSGTSAVTFSYNDLSQRTQMAYSNGATVDYTPQLNEDVTSITHNFVGSSVVFTYGYNDVHEPTSLNISDGAYMYHPGAASVSYATADSVNAYPTVGGTSYSYDGNMNLAGDGVWTYGYDTENHLLTAAKTGTSASFVYDPLHRQSQKTVGSVKSRYVYSGWQRIADYDGVAGTLQNRYVYGVSLDEPLVQVSSGGTLTFLHADKVGSIVATSNNSGVVTNQNLYGPFGELAALGGTNFGYTGQRYDPELGLHYFKARYQSSSLGRFLQPDPIGYVAEDFNLYTYVLNSPLLYNDPMGLKSPPPPPEAIPVGTPQEFPPRPQYIPQANPQNNIPLPPAYVPGNLPPGMEPPGYEPGQAGLPNNEPATNAPLQGYAETSVINDVFSDSE
ncbi:MAG: RHS repeat-associated core domain-containing protein [Candidatus Melainabacteria bacterium]|nr:RHS repeat-associated core domain-containing protein [Candidatus Melainabacteria bacterium]